MIRAPHASYSLLALLLFALMLFRMPELFRDPDTGWHLTAGHWILQHARLTVTDPFSHTAGDYPWLNIAWAWDVAMAALERAGGWWALGIAHSALFAVICTGLLIVSRRLGAGLIVSILLLIVALPLLGALSTVRPHAISFALAGLSVWWLQRWRDGALSNTALTVRSVVLMIVWVNIHGAFLAWLTLMGAYGLDRMVHRDMAGLRALMMCGVAGLAATLLNPLGVGVYEACLRTLGGDMAQHISEWQPVTLRPERVPALLFPLATLMLLVPLWRYLEAPQRLLVPFWLVAGLLSQRYLPLFILINLPFLAVAVTRYLQAHPLIAHRLEQKERDYDRDLSQPRVRRAALVVAVVASIAVPAAMVAHQPPPHNPLQAEVEALTPYRCLKLWNHYNLGGWIIYHSRGDWPVFVDGRAETAYPQAVLSDYLTVNELGLKTPRILERHAIELMLFPTTSTHLATYLAHHPDWKKLNGGEHITAYIRKDAKPCL